MNWKHAVFFCLFSGIALAGPNIEPIQNPTYRLNEDPDSPDRLTFAGLKAWIQDHQISDIDSLFASWEADSHRWQMMQSFNLMYNSRSIQRTAVDPLHPRVLFHKDGLIGAVTGNPSKPDFYRQMEIIEFEPEAHRWAFHAVTFPAHAGEAVKFEDNPARCTECHGEKPRPIWGSYPLWPGAYFGDRDESTISEGRNLDTFYANLNQPEMKRYRYFVKDHSSLSSDANLTMSLYLSFINFNRMFWEMKRSPMFEAYQYALYVAANTSCGSIENFLPEKVRKLHEARLGMNAAAVIADTKAQSHKEYQYRMELYRTLAGRQASSIEFDADYAEQVGRMRYLIDGQGLDTAFDMKNWAMSYQPGSYSYNFSTGNYGFTDLTQREFGPYMKSIGYGAYTYSELDCERLKQRSLDVLGKL